MNELESKLGIRLDDLSKIELKELKGYMQNQIKPYEDKINDINNRIRNIEQEEYLKNRSIKNHPILNELINELGDDYRYVIIDIDEFLGRKRYPTIRIYNEISKACDKYDIEFTYKLVETIKNFMVDNNIIAPEYEICCPRCNETITTFNTNPMSENFIEDLKIELDGFPCIDGNMLYCDTCEEEIDLTDTNNISQSDFYQIIR